MLNNTRSKPTVFGAMVGYITKKELGEDKGVHIHAAIIYNGNIVKDKNSNYILYKEGDKAVAFYTRINEEELKPLIMF
jgi:hypothetical protein